jgi:hypothetical protein
MVRKREEVELKWAKFVVSVGLPMSFFDNPDVHKTVLMTECGQSYIRTKPGGVKEPTLSHHTIFTTKLIPKLDKLVDDKNMGKMRQMTSDQSRIVCKVGSHNLHSDMNDREPGAFHTDYMKSDMHVWIKTFFKSWPTYVWLTLKVVFLTCSVSHVSIDCRSRVGSTQT